MEFFPQIQIMHFFPKKIFHHVNRSKKYTKRFKTKEKHKVLKNINYLNFSSDEAPRNSVCAPERGHFFPKCSIVGLQAVGYEQTSPLG